MNLSKKIVTSCFTVFTSIVSLASTAVAGEGGAAGAVSFSLESGVVTGVAQAAAIGKNGAAAAAFNSPKADGIKNFAYALGSADTITLMNLGNPTIAQITSTADTALGTAQMNQLSSNATIKIGTMSGDTLIGF